MNNPQMGLVQNLYPGRKDKKNEKFGENPAIFSQVAKIEI